MAHLEGYSDKATVRKMLAHYERSFECEKENIDFTRTPRNKNYAPHREEGQENYLDSLLNEIPTIKSTTNILSDWIITLPKNEDLEKREDDFFQATYNWFVKMLPEGERSVISAYVHYDESQPHLHIAFCPLTKTTVTRNTTTPLRWTKKDEIKNPVHRAGEVKRDKKGNIRYEREDVLDEAGSPVVKTTLSQTGIFTRSKLKSIHSDLEKALCNDLELDYVGIVLDEDDVIGKALSYVPQEYLNTVKEHFEWKESQIRIREQNLEFEAKHIDIQAKKQDRREHELRAREDSFVKQQAEILQSIELTRKAVSASKKTATAEEWGAGFIKQLSSIIPNPKLRDILKNSIEKYVSYVNRDVGKAISIAKEALSRRNKSREELSSGVFYKAVEIEEKEKKRELHRSKGGLSR